MDAVRAAGPFGKYEVVVVPNLYIIEQPQADALRTFVEGGGHLVVGPFSGVVDASEKVLDGGAPGLLRDLLGIEVDEQWPIADGLTKQIDYDGELVTVSGWSEWREADADVEVRGCYASGDLDGRPAVTRRTLREGVAWYLSAMLAPDGMRPIFCDVLRSAGLPARDATDVDVEVVTRADDTTDYTFFLNHGRAPVAFELSVPGEDLLTGIRHDQRLELGRFGVAVLASPRTQAIPFSSLVPNPAGGSVRSSVRPCVAPEPRAAMLAAVGAASGDEMYVDVPDSLRLNRPIDLVARTASLVRRGARRLHRRERRSVFVMELPSRLSGLESRRPGWKRVRRRRLRTHLFRPAPRRKERVGTAAALWGIAAGVHLSLMGPAGMAELAEMG